MTAPVHRISIPNPFFEGRNSVYVLRTDPVTLIDTGVATDKAYHHLVEGLSELGLTVTDVERVILTHKHIDHIGNAWRIHQQGGAEVFIHESECKSLTNVDPSGKRFSELVHDRMRGWGVPSESRARSTKSKMPQWILEPCEVTGLSDGQQLPLAQGHLEVLHTPGHTAGSICLQWGDELFSGDHVLLEISPNVGAGDLRSRGLLGDYMASLERVRDLPLQRTHPGHGETFNSPIDRCNELLLHHEQRLDAIEGILRRGPASVYDVALALFGELDDFHIVLGCAEANAHLEVLEDRDVVCHDEGRYRITR